MADANIISEWLVSLGFKIDEAQKQSFLDTIAAATVKIVGLGAAVEAAAVAVVAGVGEMAKSLDSLYFVAQRVNATVGQIKALAFAGQQMGLGAGQMRSSLESLAQFIRSNPGAGELLLSLGIYTIDPVTGKARSTENIMQDIGERLKRMPTYQALQYGNMLGIDQNTLLVLMRGTTAWTKLFDSMKAAMGVDFTQSAKSANLLWTQLRDIEAIFGLIGAKVVQDMGAGLAAQLKRFSDYVLAHGQEIARFVADASNLILKLGRMVLTLGIDIGEALDVVYEWFNSLSSGGKQLTEIIGGVIAALVLLRTGVIASMAAFITSPIGLVIAALGALLLALQDYYTYTHGGKAYFDWGKLIGNAAPQLKALRDNVLQIWTDLKKIYDDLGGLQGIFGNPKMDPNSGLNGYLVQLNANLKALNGYLADVNDFFKANPWLTEGLPILSAPKGSGIFYFAIEAPGLEAAWTTFSTWWNGWNARFNVVNGTFWKGIGKTIVDAIEGAISYLKTCIESFLKWFGLTVPKGIADSLTEGIEPVRLFEQAFKDVEVAVNDVIKAVGALLALVGGPAKKVAVDIANLYASVTGQPPIPSDTEAPGMASAYGLTTVLPDTTSPEFQQQYGMQRGGVLNPSGFFARQGERWTQGFGGMNARQKLAMKYFMSVGYTQAQAAALVANLTAESGMDPTKIGDNGLAKGLAQWHPDRWNLMSKMFGGNTSFNNQLAFAAWELRNTENVAGTALRRSRNAAAAAAALDTGPVAYERSADTPEQAAARGQLASDINNSFASGGGAPAPAPTAANTPLSIPPITVTAHAASVPVTPRMPTLPFGLGAPRVSHKTEIIHHHNQKLDSRPVFNITPTNQSPQQIAELIAKKMDQTNAALIRNLKSPVP